MTSSSSSATFSNFGGALSSSVSESELDKRVCCKGKKVKVIWKTNTARKRDTGKKKINKLS